MRFPIVARIVLAFCLFSITAAAADQALFSEDVKIDVKKLVITRSFKATADSGGKITITNGLNWPKASSVKVILNGVTIVTRKNVNKNVAQYTGDGLTLQKNNTIKIIARRNPGRFLIEIFPSANNGGGGGGGGNKAIFSRVIGYGDSLLAGFIDGTLVERLQTWNFGAQIAKQANFAFVLPLISEPGVPSQKVIIQNGILDILPDQNPGIRINPEETLNDFAVPGATAASSVTIRDEEMAHALVLGGSRTMMEWLQARNPSLVLLWIGSNDVLDMILSTDPDRHTNLQDFSTTYEGILKNIQKETNKIVAANIPDVTRVAFLIDPNNPPVLKDTFKLFVKAPAGSLITGTYFLSVLQRLLSGNLNVQSPTDADLIYADELDQIRATVQAFNAEIARLCAKYKVPLVDIYSVSEDWAANGLMVGGQKLTTQLLGGIFGLDGLHPTITTHAVIANLFMQKINDSYGQNLAMIDVASVHAQDPDKPLSFGSGRNINAEQVEGMLNGIRNFRRQLEATRDAVRAAREAGVRR